MAYIDPNNWLLLERTVRFGDTDGAGVMHFHHIFRWAHETWEESLQLYGLEASKIFPLGNLQSNDPKIALPVVNCEANFFHPIRTGDDLLITLDPHRIDSGSFEITTKFKSQDREVALSLVRHFSIDSSTRSRCTLPECIELWLEASSVNLGIKPL